MSVLMHVNEFGVSLQTPVEMLEAERWNGEGSEGLSHNQMVKVHSDHRPHPHGAAGESEQLPAADSGFLCGCWKQRKMSFSFGITLLF